MSTETEVEVEVQEEVQTPVEEVVHNFDAMSDDEIRDFQFPDDITSQVYDDDHATEVTDEQEATSEVEGTKPQEEVSTEGVTDSSDGQPTPSTEEATTSGIVGKTVKVGGVEIKIESEEEALKLIQRGLGANKRNQELAPKMKYLSMLEKNGMLDSDKLNFMIDLANGKPEAIKKLISDKEVDTFDLSTGEVGDYQPEDHTVSDSELAVAEAFDSISADEKYSDTVSTIDGFDSQAKQILTDTPSLITEFHSHVSDGTYDEAMKIVEIERAKGNINGLGDYQAYQHVMKVVKEYSAGTGSNQEAGHNNNTNGQQAAGKLAGNQGTGEAVNEQGANSQVGNRPATLSAAAQAAQSTTTVRGVDDSPTVIDFDKMTDEQIRNFDYSQL